MSGATRRGPHSDHAHAHAQSMLHNIVSRPTVGERHAGPGDARAGATLRHKCRLCVPGRLASRLGRGSAEKRLRTAEQHRPLPSRLTDEARGTPRAAATLNTRMPERRATHLSLPLSPSLQVQKPHTNARLSPNMRGASSPTPPSARHRALGADRLLEHMQDRKVGEALRPP